MCYSVFFTEKIPSDATFFGAQYFTYNLSGQGDGLVSNRDSISLDFRTKHPDGLLFYTGKEPTFSCLCVRECEQLYGRPLVCARFLVLLITFFSLFDCKNCDVSLQLLGLQVYF